MEIYRKISITPGLTFGKTVEEALARCTECPLSNVCQIQGITYRPNQDIGVARVELGYPWPDFNQVEGVLCGDSPSVSQPGAVWH